MSRGKRSCFGSTSEATAIAFDENVEMILWAYSSQNSVPQQGSQSA
jgi:hypothetical protein